ncbi:DUF4258 domain-containing protein [Aequorivita viscosa]|uniref:DUF4258 domain-containing protein n=1 Tax=Aequorivita viscosa TaxID=797419 RepID=A0A1M6EE94_9FLAO|nr:DUF4258 domain-containing protein [Aequorivita viscosa]SDW01519.1 hypothetical protein SAMN05216556_101119 [Aequorivita viscosa]SHI83812.1 hypothetical protein SAMN04487908_10648 [Aequorivita viscosa]
MKLKYRLAYFSGGLFIGILLVIFILSGKKTSCAYGLDARTLKNIRLKERAFSDNTLQFLKQNQMDTSAVSILLLTGDVNFSESNTKLDSCKQYVVVGKVQEKNLKLRIENCEKVATVMTATFDD